MEKHLPDKQSRSQTQLTKKFEESCTRPAPRLGRTRLSKNSSPRGHWQGKAALPLELQSWDGERPAWFWGGTAPSPLWLGWAAWHIKAAALSENSDATERNKCCARKTPMCPNLKATGALKQQQLEIELQLHGPRQLLMEAECSQHRGCQPSSVPKQGNQDLPHC